MKIFLTGGTGFIGRRLAENLIERGHEVIALVRSENGAGKLASLGVKIVPGDLDNLPALQEGMQGCEAVFHVAGWYKLGARDKAEGEKVNVAGTRNVLETAVRLGIPRILYTSTIAVLGDTHGSLPDETYRPPKGPFLTEYDRTKWIAHYEIAEPLIQRGAPIIILMPGGVIGPGDTSLIGMLMEGYVRALFPFFPGPETGFTCAHVDDIVTGHILALEKGRLGETYLLAGPALTLREMVPLWAKASGCALPLTYIPSRYLKPFIPVMRILEKSLPLPSILSTDGIRVLGATYFATADKARRELCWQLRPLEEAFAETLAYFVQKSKDTPLLTAAQKRAALIILVAALLLWKARPRRQH